MQEALLRAMEHWKLVAPIIQTPVCQNDYEQLLENLSDAMDIAQQQPHPAMASLIKSMASAAEEFEQNQLEERQLDPIHALRYLVKLHGIKQSDLKEIGSQGVVSEVLNGKRPLTLRHVKELANKFDVSPNVFISNT